jgi:hypothetical protein
MMLCQCGGYCFNGVFQKTPDWLFQL